MELPDDPGTGVHRWLALPDSGTLIITPDLHGNGEDFRRMRTIVLDQLERDRDTHWVILGDVVHAPNEEARRREPALYDYDDESGAIVEGILTFQRDHPGRVHYILGNHDFGHVGGPPTAKFHPDEVAYLESRLATREVHNLHALFARSLLAVAAPCGVLMTHGSPGDRLRDLDDLNRVTLPTRGDDPELAALTREVLTSYGQPHDVTDRLLKRLSRPGLRLRLVVHGHDRDSDGYFEEGGNQVCPVIFGAPRGRKAYLTFDLSARYARSADLIEGRHVRRLYSPIPH